MMDSSVFQANSVSRRPVESRSGDNATATVTRVLIIEDEDKSAHSLEKGLCEQGFSIALASDGEEGLRAARAGNFDLIILDIMLPKSDGWTVLKRLREVGDRTPVIFLTARDAVEDRVSGLTLGADDYLVKPFAFSELVARIHTVLRRDRQRVSDPLKVDGLEIDLVRHRATRDGKPLELTPKEFALLYLLTSHRGQVLSRAAICREVWDMSFDSDTNVVDVHVRRLRAKLDDPFPRKLIHTVRGLGYVFDETR